MATRNIAALTTQLPAISTDTEQEQKALVLLFIWNRGLTTHDFELGLGFDADTADDVMAQLLTKGLVVKRRQWWPPRSVYELSKRGQQMVDVACNLADAIQAQQTDHADSHGRNIENE